MADIPTALISITIPDSVVLPEGVVRARERKESRAKRRWYLEFAGSDEHDSLFPVCNFAYGPSYRWLIRLIVPRHMTGSK